MTICVKCTSLFRYAPYDTSEGPMCGGCYGNLPQYSVLGCATCDRYAARIKKLEAERDEMRRILK